MQTGNPRLENQVMSELVRYKYLEPKRGSRYQQLAVGGRIRAEILYRETLGAEPLSPEQVAQEYNLPVEAVLSRPAEVFVGRTSSPS
jgi:hypothetical protein